MTTEEALELVVEFVEDVADPQHSPWDVVIDMRCTLVEKDHEESDRVFAHVFHHPWTICVAEAFDDLEAGHKLGILLHEFGHLYGGQDDATADLWVEEQLGIDLRYVDLVQWVDPDELATDL